MKKIFEETKIKDITLKNRFARSGTWIAKATENGDLTPEFFAYYEKIAKANLGFAMVGYARVLEDEKANNNMVGMWDDKFIPNLKKLTDMFHENNTPVGIQIAMGGSQVHYQGDITWKLQGPSSTTLPPRVDSYGNTVVYQSNEMTIEEIQETINKFAEAAVRVKKAGFDMVQIHAGHGYFISQWLNPELNTRTDEYGQNKCKFILDLYTAIRNAVGNDFKIGIKVNSEEKVGDHSNHDLVLDLCTQLDKAGIDLIEVSGTNPSRTKATNPNGTYFIDFAKKLTAAVNCTTMITGGNKSFNDIEKMLNETNVDIVGLSRPLIAETDLVQKWEKDNTHVAKCISCNHCHKVTNVCVFEINK